MASRDTGLEADVHAALYIYDEVVPALNQRASKSINIYESEAM